MRENGEDTCLLAIGCLLIVIAALWAFALFLVR